MKENDANSLKLILSSHFRATRTHLSLSQSDMAELLHVSARYYSDLERGVSLCSLPTMLRYIHLCRRQQIPHEELLCTLENCLEILDEQEENE